MSNKETVMRLAEASGKKFGGCLDNWSVHKVYKEVEFVMGILDGEDPTHRFNKGDTVRTSAIKWLDTDFDYVETANTFYMLGKANPNPLPDGLAANIYF